MGKTQLKKKRIITVNSPVAWSIFTLLTCGLKLYTLPHLRLVSLAFRNSHLRLPLEKHIFSQKQI